MLTSSFIQWIYIILISLKNCPKRWFFKPFQQVWVFLDVYIFNFFTLTIQKIYGFVCRWILFVSMPKLTLHCNHLFKFCEHVVIIVTNNKTPNVYEQYVIEVKIIWYHLQSKFQSFSLSTWSLISLLINEYAKRLPSIYMVSPKGDHKKNK